MDDDDEDGNVNLYAVGSTIRLFFRDFRYHLCYYYYYLSCYRGPTLPQARVHIHRSIVRGVRELILVAQTF